MKASNYLFIVIMLAATGMMAQNRQIDKYFTVDPGDIMSANSAYQEYDVTLKWQNLDAIDGSKINCNAVKATYFTGREEGYAGWKDVSLAWIDDFQQKEFKGTELPLFDNFSYRVLDTAFLSEELYKNIPAEQRDLAKWLVSDAAQMQVLAWYVFDSLTYNKEFMPDLLEDYQIRFENWVIFTSRYQKLIWSGIGKHHDEICAIVRFESLYNPVEIDNEQMQMKGRSLYYGEMWISLSDKQVEYASMVEDVIMRLKSSLFPDEQIIDLQREIVFNKVN